MPRARSAQDVPTGPRPNLVSGEPMVPVVAMGSAAVANTFEGESVIQHTTHTLTSLVQQPVVTQHAGRGAPCSSKYTLQLVVGANGC